MVRGFRGGIDFATYTSRLGMSGADALPEADPNHDGISNLEAMASDIALTGDSGRLSPIVSFQVNRFLSIEGLRTWEYMD